MVGWRGPQDRDARIDYGRAFWVHLPALLIFPSRILQRAALGPHAGAASPTRSMSTLRLMLHRTFYVSLINLRLMVVNLLFDLMSFLTCFAG